MTFLATCGDDLCHSTITSREIAAAYCFQRDLRRERRYRDLINLMYVSDKHHIKHYNTGILTKR